MDKALVLKNVSLLVDKSPVFTDVNLEVNRGEIVSFCSLPSGNLHAFETLLLHGKDNSNIFSGSIEIDSAKTELLSEDALRFLRMVNIGVLPLPSSVGSLRMTVQTYITLPFRENIKKSAREILLDAKRIMELLGVHKPEAIMHKKMVHLSETELRAVLYAAALSTDPCIAVCYADTKMQEAEKETFFTLLIKICKIKNTALILLTTDVLFAKQYGESVYIFDDDRVVLYENANESLRFLLESSASASPIPKAELSNEDVIRVSHMKATKRDEKIDFTLYKKEIVSFPCEYGSLIFTGKKRPYHGNVYADNIALPRNKAFQKKIMHIFGGFPIIPGENVRAVLRAFCARHTLQENMGRILDSLPLPKNYLDKSVGSDMLFDTLYLGLLCAAMAEAKLILLSDIDKLSGISEKYELLSLLSAICQRTGAGAIIFSEDAAVHQAVSSKLYIKPTIETLNEERTNAYANAT